MLEQLNPLTLPLQGSQLIEASAGTGKTWTIAALYVRLALGHGDPGMGRPLLPGEILVMTFTKAATRELSDRIRRRLVAAAACFRDPVAHPPDAFLAGLLQAYPAGPLREQAAWRLAMAAEAMDDAAVHTIDAWCQRMLREHAFDSGCLFDEELQASEAALRDQAARDYWRQQVYPLERAALDAVLALWAQPDALARDLQALLGKPLPPDAGQGTLADALARGLQQRQQALSALKAGWAERADRMLAWLQAVWSDKKHPAAKAVPRQQDATGWLAELKGWALDADAEDPNQTKASKERLSVAGLRARLGDATGVNLPPEFADFDNLMAALSDLPTTGPALRLHAAAGVAARMQQMKRQAGRFGFADMLDRLDTALDPAQPAAPQLRQRILAQYPAALIDEFQDTSPVQLRIFDRLYRIADNDPARVLLLIGDPKQAIYGFRGADIYSYLRAREATRGRHHVLGTNHRSTVALVDAVNSVFGRAEARAGAGAFQFRAPGAAADASPLPFVAVAPQGRAESLFTSAGAEPALTAVLDAELRNTADSRERLAALCAERIVALLNDAQAGFVESGQPLRRLRPADMAVLVRSGTEAGAVRGALRLRGLASVYLSDKDTVFQTAEAGDLLRLLQAVATPRDVRLVRAALATPLLGLSLDELLQLASVDEAFDQRCELLQQLHQAWKGQGVLAMLRRALHAFDLPARLLASSTGMGERSLTNVLHLAELLQAASAQVEGEQALIRWLGQQMADGDASPGAGDERVLRLESDADLVQVVTVHKSKGLEYPLVFLPFAAHFRDVDSGKDAVLLLPGGAGGADGAPQLVLSPTAAQCAVAEQERQREQLRLLYVALTRARHAVWLGLSGLQVGPGKHYTWHRSAIGYLLSGAQEQAPEQRVLDVQAWAAACPQVALQVLPLVAEGAKPSVALTPVQPRQDLPPLNPAPAYHASFDRQWAISSYSALVRDAAWGLAAAGQVPARVLREDEPADEAATEPPARRPADQPWHRFPRGAFAGNFLHEQLEWLAGEGFALDASSSLQQQLLRRCERQGWGHRGDDVLAWLRVVCSTPLPALGAPGVPGVPLSALGSLRPEMEFWFPSDGLLASRVDSLCCSHLLPGRPRPGLPERTLKGLLMGFADLVFEHQGRYWVLDYKSNALGARDADYTAAAMEDALLEHRYDVQAVLYLLALHRLLKARLGAAYDPARQLGGAVYLFLRGVRSPGAGCCHVAPPLALLDALDALLPPATAGALA